MIYQYLFYKKLKAEDNNVNSKLLSAMEEHFYDMEQMFCNHHEVCLESTTWHAKLVEFFRLFDRGDESDDAELEDLCLELGAHNIYIDPTKNEGWVHSHDGDEDAEGCTETAYFSRLDNGGRAWYVPQPGWEVIPYFVWDSDSPDFHKSLDLVRELVLHDGT